MLDNASRCIRGASDNVRSAMRFRKQCGFSGSCRYSRSLQSSSHFAKGTRCPVHSSSAAVLERENVATPSGEVAGVTWAGCAIGYSRGRWVLSVQTVAAAMAGKHVVQIRLTCRYGSHAGHADAVQLNWLPEQSHHHSNNDDLQLNTAHLFTPK